MNRDTYEILYSTEESYWWFKGQRLLLKHYLDEYCKGRKGLKLLDVGCGTGITMKMLQEYGTAYGIDISDNSIEFCRKRGLKNIKKSDAMNINFRSGTFDAVTTLGVFYHKKVTDDIKGMKELYRVLKPKGMIFFFDCAMMSLFGKHDIAFHGTRRYSRNELRSKLERAGFKVEKISYINTSIFPAIYLKRKLEKLTDSKPKSEIQDDLNPLLNNILYTIYKAEIIGSRYVSYPFGVNIFAVARKK